jgi:formate hydrogenlyase subunit 3/multisubunit Na+/H+ antiporter MnhD subunit
MIWGNVAAIAQTNIKRMLAYSSIAHAGYLLVAVAAGSTQPAAPGAVSAALFYLLAYGVTTIGAWAVVLALEHADGSGTSLDDYAGLARRRPWVALAMSIFMLSLIGVPPTLGFLGKFVVFGSAVQAGLIGLAVIAVLTSRLRLLLPAGGHLRTWAGGEVRRGLADGRHRRHGTGYLLPGLAPGLCRTAARRRWSWSPASAPPRPEKGCDASQPSASWL